MSQLLQDDRLTAAISRVIAAAVLAAVSEAVSSMLKAAASATLPTPPGRHPDMGPEPAATVDYVAERGSCDAHCERQRGAVCIGACDTEPALGCSCDTSTVWSPANCKKHWPHRLCACAKDDVARRATAAVFGPPMDELRTLADDRVRRALAASADPMCNQSLAVPAELRGGGDGGPSGASGASIAFAAEAAAVLRTCGHVLLRGALAPSFVREYRAALASHLHALHVSRGGSGGGIGGNASSSGSAGSGGVGGPLQHRLHRLHRGRWELLLSRAFAPHELLGGSVARAVLSHPSLLSPDLSLHSLGVALSEPGAPAQHWHRDAPFPLNWATSGDDGGGGDGDGGGGAPELPPFAATALVPLSDVGPEDGPTELCVGSHHTSGLSAATSRLGTTAAADAAFRAQAREQLAAGTQCGAASGLSVAAPSLLAGDLLLFDYATLHRGGANASPRLRPLLYVTYARPWYRDTGNWREPPPPSDGDGDVDGDGDEGPRIVAGRRPDALGAAMLRGARLAPPTLTKGTPASATESIPPWPTPRSPSIEALGGAAPLNLPLFPSYDDEAATPIGHDVAELRRWLGGSQTCPLAAAWSQPFMASDGLY